MALVDMPNFNATIIQGGVLSIFGLLTYVVFGRLEPDCSPSKHMLSQVYISMYTHKKWKEQPLTQLNYIKEWKKV